MKVYVIFSNSINAPWFEHPFFEGVYSTPKEVREASRVIKGDHKETNIKEVELTLPPTFDQKKYLERLVELQSLRDFEDAHGRADCLLCEILKELGLEDIVTEYDKVRKEYA